MRKKTSTYAREEKQEEESRIIPPMRAGDIINTPWFMEVCGIKDPKTMQRNYRKYGIEPREIGRIGFFTVDHLAYCLDHHMVPGDSSGTPEGGDHNTP